MGLGKTLTALALAFEYREEWPVLVVCPPTLRHQWRSQVLHWLGHVLKPEQVQIIMQGKAELSADTSFVIVPYSLVHHEKFQRRHDGETYEVVVCDESHYIKEEKALRTRSVVPLLQAARRAVLLSGTPSLNHAAELYTQVQAVLGSHFTAFSTFGQRYANSKFVRFANFRGEKFSGVKRPEELGVLLHNVMIRRRKEDVLTQLPRKRRQRVVISASNAVALRDANRRLGQLGADDGEELPEGLPEADVRDVFKLVCEAKLKSTQDYVSYLLEGVRSKVLLFAHHKIMLDAVEQTLRAQKVRFIRIDGGVPHQRRPELIHSFQQDPGVTCALLSITACAEGLNLTSASTVVFCELYWVPGIMEQCEARAHRMGQESMVDVHYIVVEGSVDEKAFWCLTRKSAATGVILDGEARTFKPDETINAEPPDRAPATREEQLQSLEALRARRGEERQAQRAAEVEERAAQRAEKQAARQREQEAVRAAKAEARSKQLEEQRLAKAERRKAELEARAAGGSRRHAAAEVQAKASPKKPQRRAKPPEATAVEATAEGEEAAGEATASATAEPLTAAAQPADRPRRFRIRRLWKSLRAGDSCATLAVDGDGAEAAASSRTDAWEDVAALPGATGQSSAALATSPAPAAPAEPSPPVATAAAEPEPELVLPVLPLVEQGKRRILGKRPAPCTDGDAAEVSATDWPTSGGRRPRRE